MEKYKLTPGEVSNTKMNQLMIANNVKPDKNTLEFPYDYIYYNYFRTDGGFIIYHELYTEAKEKKLNKFFVPDTMIEDLISQIAAEKLIED